MTYVVLHSVFTSVAFMAGPYPEAPGAVVEPAQTPAPGDDRAALEAAGALPMIDFTVEVVG